MLKIFYDLTDDYLTYGQKCVNGIVKIRRQIDSRQESISMVKTKLAPKWGVTFRRKFGGVNYAYLKSGSKSQARHEANSLRKVGIAARVVKSSTPGEYHVYSKER